MKNDNDDINYVHHKANNIAEEEDDNLISIIRIELQSMVKKMMNCLNSINL